MLMEMVDGTDPDGDGIVGAADGNGTEEMVMIQLY